MSLREERAQREICDMRLREERAQRETLEMRLEVGREQRQEARAQRQEERDTARLLIERDNSMYKMLQVDNQLQQVNRNGAMVARRQVENNHYAAEMDAKSIVHYWILLSCCHRVYERTA